MPHIHLLTSANLVENVDLPDILRSLVDELCVHETVDARATKAYHSLFHTWVMGENAPTGFAHCRVYLLSGRSIGLKAGVADAMFARMQACFRESADRGEVLLSVELIDMDRDSYRKTA